MGGKEKSKSKARENMITEIRRQEGRNVGKGGGGKGMRQKRNKDSRDEGWEKNVGLLQT